MSLCILEGLASCQVRDKLESDCSSVDELALIRNEVFVRYGSIFDTEFYQTYFGLKSWYHPSTKNISMDSVVKVKVDLIQP